MSVRFTAEEVADSFERGYAFGYTTAVTRAAANLYTAAQEYGAQGREEHKALTLALWLLVLSLHDEPNNG